MKILMLSDAIISMDNVRSARVTHRDEDSHTRKGSRVTDYKAVITIAYQAGCGEDEYIYITANTEKERESEIHLILNNIAEILKKD